MINTTDIKNNIIRFAISATKYKYKLIESIPCLYYDDLMKKLLTTYIIFYDLIEAFMTVKTEIILLKQSL